MRIVWPSYSRTDTWSFVVESENSRFEVSDSTDCLEKRSDSACPSSTFAERHSNNSYSMSSLCRRLIFFENSLFLTKKKLFGLVSFI